MLLPSFTEFRKFDRWIAEVAVLCFCLAIEWNYDLQKVWRTIVKTSVF